MNIWENLIVDLWHWLKWRCTEISYNNTCNNDNDITMIKIISRLYIYWGTPFHALVNHQFQTHPLFEIHVWNLVSIWDKLTYYWHIIDILLTHYWHLANCFGNGFSRVGITSETPRLKGSVDRSTKMLRAGVQSRIRMLRGSEFIQSNFFKYGWHCPNTRASSSVSWFCYPHHKLVNAGQIDAVSRHRPMVEHWISQVTQDNLILMLLSYPFQRFL